MNNYYKIESTLNPETSEPFFEGSIIIKSEKDLSLPENKGLIPVLASVELHNLGINVSHELLENSSTYSITPADPPQEIQEVKKEIKEDDGFAPGVWGELGYRNRR